MFDTIINDVNIIIFSDIFGLKCHKLSCGNMADAIVAGNYNDLWLWLSAVFFYRHFPFFFASEKRVYLIGMVSDSSLG